MSALLNIAVLGLAGAGMVAAQAPAAAPGGCVSLTDAAMGAGNLNTLSAAVASLLGEGNAVVKMLADGEINLPEDQKFTVFAPEDAAWPPEAQLPTGQDLLDLILGHVADAYFPSAALKEAFQGMGNTVDIPTLAVGGIAATFVDPDIYVAGPGMLAPGAKVIKADIETCVGVIHIVDAVLMPDAATPGAATRDIALAPGPAALAAEPTAEPTAVTPAGFVPSTLTPPGVAPTPAGAGAAAAPVEVTADAGEGTTPPGAVEGPATDAANTLVATTIAAAAAAIALLV